MEFISEKAQDVLRLDEFEEISKRTAIMIFMRPDLKATEERKWDAAYRWSRRYCRRRELNHFRRTMKIFTRRINFLDIPVHKLVTEIRPLEIVPEYLIAGAISHQSGPRLVIGQEKQPMATPLKPPRRRLVEKRNVIGRGSVRRKGSSASVTSSSSSSSSTSRAHSCDSGFSSSAEICARIWGIWSRNQKHHRIREITPKCKTLEVIHIERRWRVDVKLSCKRQKFLMLEGSRNLENLFLM